MNPETCRAMVSSSVDSLSANKGLWCTSPKPGNKEKDKLKHTFPPTKNPVFGMRKNAIDIRLIKMEFFKRKYKEHVFFQTGYEKSRFFPYIHR